jgi:hypothetical protein
LNILRRNRLDRFSNRSLDSPGEPSLFTGPSFCSQQTRAIRSGKAMIVGGPIFESYSHYRFSPYSHHNNPPSTTNSSHSSQRLFQRNHPVDINSWQSRRLRRENQHSEPQMASTSQDEMENFQQLSDRYQPDVQVLTAPPSSVIYNLQN